MGEPVWIGELRAQLPLEARMYSRLHLAVFSEPFLSDVLAGKKTMESRFSKHRIAPYGRVRAGDGVLVKAAGGSVVAIFRVGSVSFFELRGSVLDDIRRAHAKELCVEDDGFWHEKASSRYATVMGIRAVQTLEPIVCAKRDRRGWVTLGH